MSSLAPLVTPVPQAAPQTALDPTEVSTLAQLYARRAQRTPAAAACRWFDAATQAWCSCSWAELEALAQRYAAALSREALVPGDRVVVKLPNGPVWLAIDWAVQALGLVMVALYDEGTAEGGMQLLGDSGARLAFVRDARAWQALQAAGRAPDLRRVVLLEGAAEGPRTVGIAQWLPAQGEALPDRADAEALATIVYTSGSTGLNRGVMLSHRNLLANVFACCRALSARSDDRLLSVLPLANLFERTAGAYLAVVVGAQTVYSRGSARLADDLQQEKPSLLIAVPRVFERLHAAVLAELEQAAVPKRALFHLAVEAGWAANCRACDVQDAPGAGPHRLLPTAVTRRVGEQFAQRLGGCLRVAVSGGAPLAPEIARTFIALGVPLMQGYGLTEAGPVVSVNRPGDNDPASVGVALDNVETRIGPDGELLVRSPSVMMGYWRDREATRRAIDDAGWLHTGDKVSRLESRRLYLTGRLKDILCTSTGLKASPADLEQRLLAQPLVDQVMVVGEARPYLAALVVADARQLAQLCGELGLDPADRSAAARGRIEAALLERCRESLRQSPLRGLLHRVALIDTPWTPANGLLTATLKLKRSAIARRHAADIGRMYEGHYTAPLTDCSSNAGV